FIAILRPPLRSTLFPYTTLFRSIQFEMMALAFQNNQTRIASMRMIREASMRVFSNVGVEEAFHPLSHHQNQESSYEKLDSWFWRSEEHTSELQSRENLVCRLLLE